MAQASLLASAVMAAATLLLLCAPTPASTQSTSGCTSALIGLMPCLGFISGNATAPSSSCCTQLASVVQSEPQCLCSVLGGGGGGTQLAGISINQTQALALPGACNVQTPPVSQCKNAAPGGPATAPPATPSSPSSNPSIPQGGSKSTPGIGTSDAGSTNVPFLLAVVAIFLGVYTNSKY